MKERVFKISSLVTEYSLYGVLFFIPISKAIIESLFVFALLGFLGKKIIQPDFRFIKTRYNLFLLAFILFSALSLHNSGQYIVKSLIALFLKWCEYILIFLIFHDSIASEKQINKAVFIFLASATLVSFDCIFQLYFGFDFLRHKNMVNMGNGIYAVRSAFNNYNDLAAYLIIVLSLIIALTVKLKDRFKLVYYWMLLIITGASFLFTFSRGGWVGLISALLLMLILFSSFRNIIVFVTFFLISIFTIPHVRERLMLIFSPGGDANRFVTWQVAINMIRENPFLGKGIGTFMDYFPRNMTWVIIGYAHNCFLQIWAETGIFSLIGFLLFLFLFFREGIKAFMISRDYLLLGLLCGLFGFVVHSFFDTHFYSLQLSFLFWSMAGVLASLIKIKQMVIVSSKYGMNQEFFLY